MERAYASEHKSAPEIIPSFPPKAKEARDQRSLATKPEDGCSGSIRTTIYVHWRSINCVLIEEVIEMDLTLIGLLLLLGLYQRERAWEGVLQKEKA